MFVGCRVTGDRCGSQFELVRFIDLILSLLLNVFFD